MANPGAGNYQQLLLNGPDNGRLKVQHQRAATRPAPGNMNRGPLWRNRQRPPFKQGPEAPRPLRHAAGGTAFQNTPQGPRSSHTSQIAAVTPSGWSSRKTATIILKSIPTNATPWDIRQFFERFGTVVWVELDDPARGSFRTAKVRFEPPPTDMSFFDQGKCGLNIGGSVWWSYVEFPRQWSEELTLTTPLGNTCPPSTSFKLDGFTFGLLTEPTTFMRKKEVLKLSGDLEMKFTADFRRKKLVIHFPMLVQREGQYYRIDIKFGIIKSIHRMAVGERRSAIIILVHDAPLFRKMQNSSDGEAWADRLVWGEEELWNRAVEIRPDSQNPLAEPVSLDKETNAVDFGRWTTYWMDLDQNGKEQWSTIETHLRDWNIATTADVSFTQIPDKSPELWDMLADPCAGMKAGTNSSSDLALLSPTAHIALPYDVRYQLEVCISHGILCEYNIGREFLEKLLELSAPSGLGVNRARLVLEYAADEGTPIYDPMNLFTDHGAMTYYPSTLHIPDYCALVRRITVTPTRIYFHTPAVETTNRIVRRYKQVQDHFTRVQFTDELLEGRVRACEVGRDDELYTRVYRVMDKGIRMGKWQWDLLAYGNSQIRECSAFFFCAPDDRSVTCDSIREWMGNFSHISSVAKFAARLGQCFSTTRQLHCISAPRIVKIPDVEKDGFCYTDGVGKISAPLACLVSEDWKTYQPPSAVQFRMGGCKGVLVMWPDAKGTEVHVRPSQEKFSAEYNGLEIIRCSQFSCATLNRQTISILSCLGVPDDIFTDMMKIQVTNYDTALTDKDKAVELLSSYVDENMITVTIASMVLNGFMHTSEPFVRTLLQLWRSWSIKALKEKARIIVDQGAFVLGCVDETGTLRGHSKATEGQKKIAQRHLPQIFLQVPDPKDRGAYRVITGLCLVGRNPSLHPGDIRVVEAVDLPQLRHLRDVVVFPLHGDRDVPSMCSGGDLDGDDFFVIWDQKLLPTEWSHPPMNYTAPKPLIEERASMAKSLAAHFVLFMKNDRLPLIAHAHLATADREVQGAKHRNCLELAQLHSTAVDYVKTGVPAEWNKKLNPRKFPHFMEKAKHNTYQSNSVLGKLYDMVRKEGFDNRENYKLPFDERILKRYQLDHAVMKAARKIKTQYDIAMRRVMGQLEIRTEFEVWTTFVMTKPRVGTDYKVQEKVGREAAGLKKQFKDMCLKEVEEKSFNRLEFVAAMYKVTWEETRIALYEARQQHVLPNGMVGLRRVTARSMPLISFPWLFPDDLGRIALNTEKLPNLAELGVSPPATKLKAKGGKGVRVETALDLEGMDYTKTSDGQYIHRGEILHLFRHTGDDEEGFFADEDVAVVESSAETPEEEEQTVDQSPTKDDSPGDQAPTKDNNSPDNFLTLLDLDTALDSASSDAVSLIQETPTNNTAPLSPGTAADLSMLDLLSFDTDDMASDPSPCLTPTKVYSQQDTTTQPAPSVADSTSEVSASSISNVTRGEAASDNTNDKRYTTESVISDSNASSWERVTSARSDSPPVVVEHEPVEVRGTARVSSPVVELVDQPLERGHEPPVVHDHEPVEYITLPAYGGMGMMGWGLGVGQARLSAAELWGRGSGSGSGQKENLSSARTRFNSSGLREDGSGPGSGSGSGSGLGGGGRYEASQSLGPGHGQGRNQVLGQNRGQNQKQSQSQGQSQGRGQSQSQGHGLVQNQRLNQNLSWDQKWTGLAPASGLTTPPVKEGETTTGSESDEEMEYEEDVVEVAGETALERAARFG